MSSFKNASKSVQRTHKERSQPAARQKLGFLEKKKDYKLRAKDHNDKNKKIRRLKKRALNKNPDEFYFHMINSQIAEDGTHREKEKEEEIPEEQILLMQTQDFRYIQSKHQMETKKIEKLKSSLHMLGAASGSNKHVFFVDNPEEVKKMDFAKRLDTVPEMLGRSYNRPRLSTLKEESYHVDEDFLKQLEEERQRSYKELNKRIERERFLYTVFRKMEVKRQLAKKKDGKPKRVKPETKNSAPVYKWKQERKR